MGYQIQEHQTDAPTSYLSELCSVCGGTQARTLSPLPSKSLGQSENARRGIRYKPYIKDPPVSLSQLSYTA